MSTSCMVVPSVIKKDVLETQDSRYTGPRSQISSYTEKEAVIMSTSTIPRSYPKTLDSK